MEEVIREASDLKVYGKTDSERDFRPYRAAKIREVLVQGYTTPFNWFTGEVPSTGLKRRVDGQHSSEVFLTLTPEEQEQVVMPIYIVRGHYFCDTEEDLAFLFMQFNQPWSSRSQEDYLGAYLANRPAVAEQINRHAAKYATAGLQWYLQKAESYPGKDQKGQFSLVLRNSAIETFLAFCGHDGLNLQRRNAEISQRPVVAAMFHTTRQGEERDRQFWRQVAGGRVVNTDEESHEYKLAAFLEGTRDPDYEWPAAVRKRFKNEYRPNHVEIFATCLRVFAAGKQHRPIREAFLPVPDQNVMTIIARLYPLPEATAAD